MSLVKVDDLRVAFGVTPVVHGVSFEIGTGECLALVGESGSGKSVTARTLVGLTGGGARVTAGELTFDGQDLTRLRERGWRRLRGGRIGFVLQDALVSLDPLRKVGKERSRRSWPPTPICRARPGGPGCWSCSTPWGCPSRSCGPDSSRTSCPAACASAR
ncbi:ATP-binding cassette domain-containing protein [Nonomuraea sp. AD125B]|uniref:ATP-binding cassette domain-containing protein n=1 Tax=Nonomuraea sp. AD125B TaxID=3242897 RepID=UPI003526F2EE